MRKGYDADLVLWDSHPLQLGATPAQVWIDGIAQLTSPVVAEKSQSFQEVPQAPDFGGADKDAVKHDGLPPLEPKKVRDVVFTNVRTVWSKEDGVFKPRVAEGELHTVVVKRGKIECADSSQACLDAARTGNTDIIDLRGGSLAPGLISFGSGLGLVEIASEYSTNDGLVNDPFQGAVPKILGDDTAIRAFDGLQFGGRNTLCVGLFNIAPPRSRYKLMRISLIFDRLAYRAGVTTVVTAPSSLGFISGLSAAFYPGAQNKLEAGAILKEIVALHVSVKHSGSGPSISTLIATLRRLLLSGKPSEGAENQFWEAAQVWRPFILMRCQVI